MASKPPLALEWLVFLRNHGADLKLSKEARVLSAVLPTYGEGKKIFATMVTLAKVTGMKRETVRNARRELQDKGLLEDITGDPAKQERTYRLTMPGYVVPERTSKVVLERTTPGPQEDHHLVLERTTPGPQEDHNIKLEDQDLDQDQHQPGDDHASLSGKEQGIDRDLLARSLGVKQVRANVWSLATNLATEYGPDAVIAAAQQCREKAQNPPGYFLRAADNLCEVYDNSEPVVEDWPRYFVARLHAGEEVISTEITEAVGYGQDAREITDALYAAGAKDRHVVTTECGVQVGYRLPVPNLPR